MATRPMFPAVINQYQRLEKLGEGGMGVVYKALDARLGRVVAIKILPGGDRGNRQRRQRFLQEARAASALNHPNIITIHEITEQDGVDSIVMEYVPGETLAQRIAVSVHRTGRGLPATQVLNYGIQIASGLGRAHSAGIIHRDLKPANIMVRSDGLIKLLDFGLAKLGPAVGPPSGITTLTAIDDGPVRTRDGAILGTAGYMSPEQVEGQVLDTRSDIFSFGIVLYEMIAGQRAFTGSSPAVAMSSVLRDEPRPVRELLADVSPELERIVGRCLRKEADRRYQHIDDVRIALEEIKDEAAKGTSVIPAAVTQDAARPRRWWAARLAGMLVAAGLLLGIRSIETDIAGAPGTPEPVTSFPGREAEPAVSPDGKQVAFVWDGDDAGNPDIFVQLIGAGGPLRLTDDPAPECCPAWAPDGKHVVFIRQHFDRNSSNRGEILMVPALGGTTRHVTEATNFGAPMSLSPDGRWLAISDREASEKPYSIALIRLPGGEKRKLTSPAGSSYGDIRPVFSPDSKALVFVRLRSFGAGDLYRLSLDDNGLPAREPIRLTFDERSIEGLDWSREGRSIYFTSNRAGPLNLWSLPVKGGSPARAPGVPDGASHISIARSDGRLVYEQRFEDTNIWRMPGPESTVTGQPPRKLVGSTRGDDSPAYSPDGLRLAFISTRSGVPELWVSDPDGNHAIALTEMGGSLIRAPSWSPDGLRIAFHAFVDRNWDVYSISAVGGSPRRLTREVSDEARATWSRDGKFIYFASNRVGSWEVWRMAAEGSAAVRVTEGGGYEALESSDGRFVYYTKLVPPGVWRVPSGGGAATEVLPLGIFGLWALTPAGIYLIQPDGDAGPTLQLHEWNGGRLRMQAKLPADKQFHFGLGLTVSPDGRWIAYGQVDQLEGDIMTTAGAR